MMNNNDNNDALYISTTDFFRFFFFWFKIVCITYSNYVGEYDGVFVFCVKMDEFYKCNRGTLTPPYGEFFLS